MQKQTNLKYFNNSKGIFKSAEKKLEKLNSNEDSLKLPYVKFWAKFLTEKKNLKETIQLLQGYDFFRSPWQVVGN